MPDCVRLGIYAMAWHYLRKRVAASRKQTIPKDELRVWLLQALEQAVDEHGQQEEA